jgi:membrane protein DedA with SNARE-associated domain
LIRDLIQRTAWGGPVLYLLAFGLAAGESALFLDFVVPGESGMVLVGASGRRASVSLPALIMAATIGSVVGDSIGFFFGCRWGTSLADRWAFTRRHIAPKLGRAERHVEHHGGRSVFVARWIGALRAVVPVVAGTSDMRYRTFVAWSSAAALSWTAVMVSLGWFFGDAVAGLVDRGGWAVSLGFLVVIGTLVWVRRRKRRRDEHAADAPRR